MINPIHILDTNNYEKIKQLGKGAYGVVFLAKNKGTGELCAAKQSYEEYKNEKEKKQDIEQELFSFCKLKHPAIVDIIGYSLTGFNGENNPVIIMKYMPNLSLANVFKNSREKLTPKRKYILILGISLALEYIHSKKIVHRDLKPGNILIDEKFHPYVSDFGISYISDIELTNKLMDSGVGTVMYQAPEMINGDSYTYKVDIYAASLIFYEIITGKKLFNGAKTNFKIMQLISDGICQDTSMINNEYIVSFLKSCWAADAKKRPRSKEIVEIVKGKQFREFFKVTEDDVNEYLSIFGQQSENNKSNEETFDSELQRLYEINDIDGMMNIGNKWRKGNDEEKRKAANLYKKLADEGCHKAMNNYAVMLYYGNGIQENKKLAAFYFKKAMKKGNLKSMMMYANMLYIGDKISKNKTEAAKLYYKLAEKGNINAAYNYAIIVLKKEINIGLQSKKRKEEIEKAVEFMKMSADGGNDEAIFEYADMLLKGREVSQNKEEAVKYYKILADKNNSIAALNYAVLLLNGKKSYIKKHKAAKYMKKAADLGEISAKYNFGMMLFHGDGVKRDLFKSKEYIKEAAEKGLQNAADFLENNFNKNSKKYDHIIDEEDENDVDDLNKEEAYPYILSLSESTNIEKSEEDSELNSSYSSQSYSYYYISISDDSDSDSKLKQSKKLIASSNSLNLSLFSIFVIRVTCTLYNDVANKCKIKFGNEFNSDLIFFDGIFRKEKFKNYHPSKHVNKIPGLWEIMTKKNFFSSLIKIFKENKRIYKDFIPITYFLPEDVDKYNQQIKCTKHLLRYDSYYGRKEILYSENENLSKDISDSIIQPFIQPFLINDRKFHIRIYLMIANIDPLTLYIYEDGEAFFCIEPYSTPTQENKNSYLFQKNFPPNLDFEPIVPLSSIIKYISKNEDEFWSKIRKIAQLSIISIHKEIMKTVKEACKINDNDFNLDDIDVIPPAKRFFNLIAIDIMIDENGNPSVSDIYDNPGMKPLNDFDHTFKSRLIASSYQLYAILLKKTDDELKNWTQILPSDDKAINFLLKKTRSSSLTSKNPKHYIPSVEPFKYI